jgi:hypothetical protein
MLYITLEQMPLYNVHKQIIDSVPANSILTLLEEGIRNESMTFCRVLINNQHYDICNLFTYIDMNKIKVLRVNF